MAARLIATATLVLAAAALAAAAVPKPHWNKPSFCHGNECPEYQVLNKTASYELRHYNSTVWASTFIKTDSITGAGSDAFQTLFDYIDGENTQKAKIPMTSPVLVQRQTDGFLVSFFMDFEFQPTPPAPSDSKVVITHLDEFKVYVAEYSGFSSDSKFSSTLKGLVSALEQDNRVYNATKFAAADYDPPFRVIGRHNEAWVWTQ